VIPGATSMLLKGKKAIVTGGAHGLGASAARAFAKEGATVALMDINDELGEKVASEISGARYYHCDKSKSQEVKSIFGKAIADMGGVDVLADSAGVSAMITPAEDITEEQLDWVLGVNLKGTIFTNQAVYHAMKEAGGGSIINFSSGAGVLPIGVADYGAAKGGVISWTRHVAKAWGPQNIRVNSICPSAVTHNMAERLQGEDLKRYQEHREKVLTQVPMNRFGEADLDIAPVLLFLASEASRYMTGQIVSVDGGYAMTR
jgi:NAD(P)-dependent dehydrogenase (short-subunit alcohol dehydrogenase family)